MQPPRDYVLVPAEYVKKGLAYKVHRGCFEHLRAVAKGILKQGLANERAFRRMLKSPMPPSLAWEALTKEDSPRDELLDWLTKLLERPK
jgi:hypothetical protein